MMKHLCDSSLINRAPLITQSPELYAVHPARYLSLGRSLVGGRDATPALNCLKLGGAIRQTCANAQSNDGWNQGVMDAALLGEAPKHDPNVVACHAPERHHLSSCAGGDGGATRDAARADGAGGGLPLRGLRAARAGPP